MFVWSTVLYEYMNLLRNNFCHVFINTHVRIKIYREVHHGIIYIANEGCQIRIRNTVLILFLLLFSERNIIITNWDHIIYVPNGTVDVYRGHQKQDTHAVTLLPVAAIFGDKIVDVYLDFGDDNKQYIYIISLLSDMAMKIACINNNKIARCLCFLEFDNFVNLLDVAMSKLKGDN